MIAFLLSGAIAYTSCLLSSRTRLTQESAYSSRSGAGAVRLLPGPRGRRGLAHRDLWISSSPASNGTALGAALGDSRASVLKGLLPAPTTTTELSQQLGLAPAAV